MSMVLAFVLIDMSLNVCIPVDFAH